MSSKVTADSRTSLIDAVKTPLGFLVLGLLVVDGTVAGLAISLTEYRGQLVWTLILSIPSFVFIVVLLALWRPEALRGDRPWQEIYAQHFANDLFMALDGALSNLPQLERAEAWLTVADVITTDEQRDAGYTKFCNAVAIRIKKLTNLSNRTINARGALQK